MLLLILTIEKHAKTLILQFTNSNKYLIIVFTINCHILSTAENILTEILIKLNIKPMISRKLLLSRRLIKIDFLNRIIGILSNTIFIILYCWKAIT